MNECIWLVTGAAGFIGSHLVEHLLLNNQRVIGVDNFSTGKQENLDQITSKLTDRQCSFFSFFCEDITNFKAMKKIVKKGVKIVLHQAALASVPFSIENPIEVNKVNVEGFLNLLEISRLNGVKRFVFASSSAIYGDDQQEQKYEDKTGQLLSPYAVTKAINEFYAAQFYRHYQLETIGLRYFNVYGLRQDPKGAYAAVIPKWIEGLKNNEPLTIYGDGSTTRDFCHVSDVVCANILASETRNSRAFGKAFNICRGEKTSLIILAQKLQNLWKERFFDQETFSDIKYEKFRPGDIFHSCGSFGLAEKELGFIPQMGLREGLSTIIDDLRSKR